MCMILQVEGKHRCQGMFLEANFQDSVQRSNSGNQACTARAFTCWAISLAHNSFTCSNLFVVLLLQCLEPTKECCIKMAKARTPFYTCSEGKCWVQHWEQGKVPPPQGPPSWVLSCLLACSVTLNGERYHRLWRDPLALVFHPINLGNNSRVFRC